jgi:hypothetical protein
MRLAICRKLGCYNSAMSNSKFCAEHDPNEIRERRLLSIENRLDEIEAKLGFGGTSRQIREEMERKCQDKIDKSEQHDPAFDEPLENLNDLY